MPDLSCGTQSATFGPQLATRLARQTHTLVARAPKPQGSLIPFGAARPHSLLSRHLSFHFVVSPSFCPSVLPSARLFADLPALQLANLPACQLADPCLWWAASKQQAGSRSSGRVAEGKQARRCQLAASGEERGATRERRVEKREELRSERIEERKREESSFGESPPSALFAHSNGSFQWQFLMEVFGRQQRHLAAGRRTKGPTLFAQKRPSVLVCRPQTASGARPIGSHSTSLRPRD